MIYVCRTTLPEDAELERGALHNDDGAGIAWLAPQPKKATSTDPKDLMVWWNKESLKTAEDVKGFIKDNKIPFPLVIHFRTASVGRASSALSHPFPTIDGVPLWTAGRAQEVLFHNGHIHGWEKLVLNLGGPVEAKFPMGEWSDSRALAWLVYLKGQGILPFVIDSSRVALFYSDPDTIGTKAYNRERDHIALYGNGWIHRDGYSQSIATEYRNRGGVVVYSSGGVGSSKPTKVADVKAFTPNPRPVIVPKNKWSIAELTEILEQIEKEQASARLVAGV